MLRSFTYGGAEHDVIQLITESDPCELTCVGMAVQTPFPLCPDLPLDHPRVPRIYQPGAQARHSRVNGRLSFAAAVKRLCSSADVLIAWGVPDLAEVVPLDYRGRIVVTSKASGAYQESFLSANALLTSDYVANSVKSGEAFPEPVRSRVRIIYPGIHSQRIAAGQDRARQRAAWGLGPDDLVVGYLGRLAPDKGIEQIVAATQRMESRWKAVFVGRNGNFPDYERGFARLCRKQLAGRFRLIDWTTNVGESLSAFDVLAYPTQEEGFANSLAEAWLLGVPTVATCGVGALAEPRWADCSITVPPGFGPDELAEALRAACGNQSLIRRARGRAKDLTVETAVERWQEYLTGVVSGSRRTRVMVLLPNALIGGIPSWLLTLMQHTRLIDWCCLCLVSESAHHAADPQILEEVLRQGCPVVGIPSLGTEATRDRLLRTIRQTRPEIVLQCGVKDMDTRFPSCGVPFVTVSHAPAECNWAREVLARSSRRAKLRAAVSASAAAAYPASHRTGVLIIPNGIEVPRLTSLRKGARAKARRELGLEKGEIAVGFVGRMSLEKCPLSVARALAELPGRYRGVFIGPDSQGLLAEIRRIAPRSLIGGPVSASDARKQIAALDVLVCPSEYESFGLAIAEAWAAMVPVVSTRVGVVAEWINKLDVAVVVPHDPPVALLASAIRRALNEQARRARICRALIAEHYDARRMGRDWQTLLRGLAGRESPSNAEGARARHRVRSAT